jgi:tRNA G18 (ribose-2'-O)-methylase SpoU
MASPGFSAGCCAIASEPPPIIRIDNPADPRIAAYRAVRERDLVGRDGLFIAEGEVVLRALLRSRLHRPVSLLLASQRVAGLSPLLAGLPAGVPVFAASQAALDGIVGFPIHRGILALGRRGPMPSAAELLGRVREQALVVVLFGTANHDNLGGVFRNAAGFGADAVLLDPRCCDPLYRKAIRVSVGATLLVPWARLGADEDPVELLAAHQFDALALSPAGRLPLADYRRPDRVAAIFGAEGPGLPPALMARLATLSIPMAAGFDSLNLATASGIVLYHLASTGIRR